MNRIVTLFQNLLRAARGKGVWMIILLGMGAGCNPWKIWQNMPLEVSEQKGGIEVTFWSPKKYYSPGEIVPVKITVENISEQPIILMGSGDDEPFFDAQYEHGRQHVWWTDQFPDLAAHQLELMPGDKFETEFTFAPTQTGAGGVDVYVSISGHTRYSFSFSVMYGATIGESRKENAQVI